MLSSRAPAEPPPWLRLSVGAAILLLGGCRSYEPVPLDLHAHHASLANRLLASDALDAFSERMRSAPPVRLDFTDGLAPEEAEVVALFYNPALRRARLDAGVTLATREYAGLWEDPVLGFDGAELISPDGPFEFGVTLGLTLPVSGRLAVERAKAGAAHAAELKRIVDAEWNTRINVRRAWARWVGASERAALLETIVERVGEIRPITEQLEAAGELGRVEGGLFRVRQAERQAELLGARLEAERARLDLLALMGVGPMADVELLAEWPRVETAPTPGGDDVAQVIAANTLLAVRRAEYAVAEEALRLEIRRQYPDITIGSGYGSEERDDRWLMGISIPLPILNANRSGIAVADAERARVRGAAEMELERLLAELVRSRATLATVRAQLVTYERDVVPVLVEQFDAVRQLAELGEVDTLLLLETITSQSEARARLTTLRVAEIEASLEIQRLLGPRDDATPLEHPDLENDDHAADPASMPAPEGGAR